MRFIHAREYLNRGDMVVVECSHQCNVMITTDDNFENYQSRKAFQYHGGHFKKLPARIAVPNDGYWNTTLDLGGGGANIKYSISYITRG